MPVEIFVVEDRAMKIERRDIADLELLRGNPRRIEPDDMARLEASIRAHGFWEHRPVAVSRRGGVEVVICGNQRLRAARNLGLQTVPVVVYEGLSEARERDIILRDNINNGAWDFEALTSDAWADVDFEALGLELPDFGEEADAPGVEADDDEVEEEGGAFHRSMLADCLYESDNIFDIPNLLSDLQAGKLQLPLSPWGALARQKRVAATYHFYVDDYRFEAIWKNPAKVVNSGCVALVEPNLSLFDTTPVAWGLQSIYKKRWIARYFQERGIRVYADLNVSRKFRDYNLLGIPAGYNAFFTRGYADRLPGLEAEYDIACKISGLQTPNLIVYGGGQPVREFCMAHNLLYVEQLMTSKRENG